MKYEHTVIKGDDYSITGDEKVLKEMSDKGWELVAAVCVVILGSGYVRLYFKRPVEEKQVL